MQLDLYFTAFYEFESDSWLLIIKACCCQTKWMISCHYNVWVYNQNDVNIRFLWFIQRYQFMANVDDVCLIQYPTYSGDHMAFYNLKIHIELSVCEGDVDWQTATMLLFIV